MLEYFLHELVDTVVFQLRNLISSTTIQNIWKNRKEETKENKLTLKNEHPENNILWKFGVVRPIIHELPEPRWIKVGRVTNLYIYPLVSGKACDADECQVTFDEIYMFKKGQLITWDRSFVVYNEKDKCIVTMKTFPKLFKVKLSFKDNYITLQTDEMPTLCVKLENKSFIKCSYSSSEGVKIFPTFTCVDCGDKVAKWLSTFLNNKISGLRLGYAMSFVNPLKMYWQSCNGHEIYFIGNMWNGHSLGPFINIVPRNSSKINQKSQKNLKTLEITDSHCMIYPTITVAISNQVLERKWEWIKIGDLIIHVSIPAVVKGSYRTFHEHVRLFGLGINCKLYQAGYIQLNDNVYVHFP